MFSFFLSFQIERFPFHLRSASNHQALSTQQKRKQLHFPSLRKLHFLSNWMFSFFLSFQIERFPFHLRSASNHQARRKNTTTVTFSNVLRKLVFHFLSNWIGYDRLNGIWAHNWMGLGAKWNGIWAHPTTKPLASSKNVSSYVHLYVYEKHVTNGVKARC